MINIGELAQKAKDANSQEMMAPVYRNQEYEIWVGVWISDDGETDTFTAASIQMGFLSI